MPTSSHRPLLLVAALALAVLPGARRPLAAQAPATGAAATATAPTAAVPRRALALNLGSMAWGYAAGEYEQAIGHRVTLGFDVGASLPFATSAPPGQPVRAGDGLAAAQARLRVYPGGLAGGIRGVSLALTAGVAHAVNRRASTTVIVDGALPAGTPPLVVTRSLTRTAPTVGGGVDYAWVVPAARRRFVVGAGLGARVVLGARRAIDGDRAFDPLGRVLPDGRVSVGYRF